MIVGIGTDLVEVERMERLIGKHPERACARLFTRREMEHCYASRRPGESFAARFAAKEAAFKALGTGWTGGLTWHDVEVLTNAAGAPHLLLAGEAARLARERRVTRSHVSLTHTRELAGAYVVLEGEAPTPRS